MTGECCSPIRLTAANLNVGGKDHGQSWDGYSMAMFISVPEPSICNSFERYDGRIRDLDIAYDRAASHNCIAEVSAMRNSIRVPATRENVFGKHDGTII